MKLTINHNMKGILILLLGIFVFSCNNEKTKTVNSKHHQSYLTDSSHIDTSSIISELVLIKPDKISLNYTLDNNYEDTVMGNWGRPDDQSSRLKCDRVSWLSSCVNSTYRICTCSFSIHV